ALHHPTPADTSAWMHPYTGIQAMGVFYNDGGDPAPVDPAPVDPPKPGPPAARTFTQAEVEALAAKEKAQGKRSAAKEFAEKNGFSTVEDAEAFIAAARQAEDEKKTEDQKRQEALDKREQDLAAREAATVARERAANRRAVLVGLGATGDDLEDAAALLRVADDADDQTVADAAAALKERRPELFGATTAPAAGTSQLPPAPGGAPAGGPPQRQAPTSKPGDRGREMARLRGHNRNAA
ncbi:hypothetical protein, partial [Streptomyces sp. 8L]|uniref:hypothetical protein n=1 Tax=Streptomyces sp. 8L TaxID=2877242 RepID=UPI0035A95434|nr:hypothetical protein [Streptomyces sp. 8L]